MQRSKAMSWNTPKCPWKTTEIVEILKNIISLLFKFVLVLLTLFLISAFHLCHGHGFCIKAVNFSAREQARQREGAHTILRYSHDQQYIRHVLKVRKSFIILLLHLPPPHSPCRRHGKVCFHDNKRIKGEGGPIQNDTSDLGAREKINHPGWIDRGKWIEFPECVGKKLPLWI